MTHSPASFGTFGSTVDDVFATDFYGFFHLEEVTKTSPANGGTMASHRNSGPFRELVVLQVAADADNQLDWLALRVVRSFVDDPREGVFARDVVASFIREGTAGQGYADAFAALLEDLRSRSFGCREVSYLDSNPLPALPRLPGDLGPAFGVYSGAEASFATRLANTDLRLSNERFDGVGALTVVFHRLSTSAAADAVRPCDPLCSPDTAGSIGPAGGRRSCRESARGASRRWPWR
jgi:hypothetical protein